MTVPPQYDRATAHFNAFLHDAKELAGLVTTNQSYTMVQGVLQAFRRRLSVEDAIRFAGELPLLVRALFTDDWDPHEPRRSLLDSRAQMTREVKALRQEHNFAPDHSIQAVARALRRHVDEASFDEVLASLPEGAVAFWNTSDR